LISITLPIDRLVVKHLFGFFLDMCKNVISGCIVCYALSYLGAHSEEKNNLFGVVDE